MNKPKKRVTIYRNVEESWTERTKYIVGYLC